MNKIKILTIGTDKSLLEEGSVAYNRQVEYYKNFELAHILVLGNSQKLVLEKTNPNNSVKFFSYGGSNRIFSYLKTFFGHLKEVRKNKYDIIYVQDVMYCGILGYVFRIFSNHSKFITQIHGDYLDNPLWINQRLENKFLNIVGKFLARKSDFVRCVSNRIVIYLNEKLKIEKEKLVSLPIGINGDEFNVKDVDINKREKKIIFCGRLISEKEPLFFCNIVIPILKKHHEFSVQFIGEGNLKDEILKKFTYESCGVDLTNRVEMLGFMGARAVARYYKAGFCLIHTAFWEGWGLPMVEASACGLPVITTDNGCAGEVIVDEVNGIVRDSKDVKVFETELERLINDKVLYEKMCSEGAKLANEWTFESMRNKTEKFLEESVK